VTSDPSQAQWDYGLKLQEEYARKLDEEYRVKKLAGKIRKDAETIEIDDSGDEMAIDIPAVPKGPKGKESIWTQVKKIRAEMAEEEEQSVPPKRKADMQLT
jgi:hypothetical protein